jgi:predicted TIM-barrel fold metal-dependent hydrolase
MSSGAIDCDIHPGVPDIGALLPYMNEFWQVSFVARGIDGFDMMSYPLNAPIICRPDRRIKGRRPGASLPAMRSQAREKFGIGTAICNPLTGGQAAVSESMGAAICSAVNDWIKEHWLDKEPRLRASIVVPVRAPLLAAEEIDRCAPRSSVRLHLAGGQHLARRAGGDPLGQPLPRRYHSGKHSPDDPAFRRARPERRRTGRRADRCRSQMQSRSIVAGGYP